MKVIIIASVTQAVDETLRIRDELLACGHDVEIPEGIKRREEWRAIDVGTPEKVASHKEQHELIRNYYEKIKEYDVVLVVNPEAKGIPGYIGANTFLEMGFAHVLHKPIYTLNPLPKESPYMDEMLAMNTVSLDGAISKIV